MTDRIWILGAPDPEMGAIERLLRQCGEQIIYATDESGRRVHPGNAYRCPVPEVPEGATVYAVECVDVLPEGWVRIDHHRPGDPGYGLPPEEFMSASSIGQVIAELARTGALRRAVQDEITHWMADNRGLLPAAEYNKMLRTQWFWTRQNMPGPNPYASDGTIARGVSWLYDGYAVAVRQNDFYFDHRVALIPPPLIYTAAADHCLAAAYRGECPGVDPDALMRWRVEQRAAHQGRSVEEVLADVERAREALMDAPVVRLSPEPWEPACGVHGRTGACWQSGGPDPSIRTDACYAMGDPLLAVDMRERVVPELPEAAAREGVCFLARLPGPDGRTKIVCQAGSPEQIRAFMTTWAPAQGIVDIYGDPARGFAGGYLAV